MCLQCHGPQLQAGPGVTPEAHSHHGANSEGNKCVACHMPQNAQTIADVSVRSHTFNFVSPSMTDKYGIPNPCTSCHKDKTTALGARRAQSVVQRLAVEDDRPMSASDAMREEASHESAFPNWAPNIHPLLVHFPIALLCAAVAVDLVAWAFGRNQPLRQAATLLYVLGTAGAVAAYVTGRAASQTVWLPGMAHAVLSQHWDWALRTVWFFAIVTGARVIFLRPSRGGPSPAVVAVFALVGLVGLGLLIETGDRGGRLVYQHGVGTIRD